MRHVSLLLALGLSISSGAAHAQAPGGPGHSSNLYVGGSGLIAYFSEIEGADYELGFGLSGLAGVQLSPNLRLEAELAYEEAEFENSADETSLIKASGSIYTDFGRRGPGRWTPYAGGGIGIVDIDVGNDEGNTELSGHLEAGFSVPIGPKLEFVPGLRVEYIPLDDIDDQIITQLRAGLRLGL